MAKKVTKKAAKKVVKKAAKKSVKPVAKENVEDAKIFAFLGVFLTVIGFLIVFFTKKDSKYAMYYAKQGLVLFIGWIIVAVAGSIPVIGWILIAPVGNIIMLVLWVIGLVNSLSGEEKPVPYIGKYADKINL